MWSCCSSLWGLYSKRTKWKKAGLSICTARLRGWRSESTVLQAQKATSRECMWRNPYQAHSHEDPSAGTCPWCCTRLPHSCSEIGLGVTYLTRFGKSRKKQRLTLPGARIFQWVGVTPTRECLQRDGDRQSPSASLCLIQRLRERWCRLRRGAGRHAQGRLRRVRGYRRLVHICIILYLTWNVLHETLACPPPRRHLTHQPRIRRLSAHERSGIFVDVCWLVIGGRVRLGVRDYDFVFDPTYGPSLRCLPASSSVCAIIK
jgi:hypothetical protein